MITRSSKQPHLFEALILLFDQGLSSLSSFLMVAAAARIMNLGDFAVFTTTLIVSFLFWNLITAPLGQTVSQEGDPHLRRPLRFWVALLLLGPLLVGWLVLSPQSPTLWWALPMGISRACFDVFKREYQFSLGGMKLVACLSTLPLAVVVCSTLLVILGYWQVDAYKLATIWVFGFSLPVLLRVLLNLKALKDKVLWPHPSAGAFLLMGSISWVVGQVQAPVLHYLSSEAESAAFNALRSITTVMPAVAMGLDSFIIRKFRSTPFDRQRNLSFKLQLLMLTLCTTPLLLLPVYSWAIQLLFGEKAHYPFWILLVLVLAIIPLALSFVEQFKMLSQNRSAPIVRSQCWGAGVSLLTIWPLAWYGGSVGAALCLGLGNLAALLILRAENAAQHFMRIRI